MTAFAESPVQVIRRCLLTWEATLGITMGRSPRERALIREIRVALNVIEGKDNRGNDD